MTQLTFLDLEARPPRCRATDPVTSAIAAERASKFANHQAEMVLHALNLVPGVSTKRLAELTGLDRYMVGRRMPELERRGLVRRGGVEDGGVCWFPVLRTEDSACVL